MYTCYIYFICYLFIVYLYNFSFLISGKNQQRLRGVAQTTEYPGQERATTLLRLAAPAEERSGPSEPTVTARRRRTTDIAAEEGIKRPTRPTTRPLDSVRGEEDHYSSAAGPVFFPGAILVSIR